MPRKQFGLGWKYCSVNQVPLVPLMAPMISEFVSAPSETLIVVSKVLTAVKENIDMFLRTFVNKE